MSRSFYRIVNNTVDSSENRSLRLHTLAQPRRTRKVRICTHVYAPPLQWRKVKLFTVGKVKSTEKAAKSHKKAPFLNEIKLAPHSKVE